MKANEVPEKIYTDENGNNPLLKRYCDSDIEYVRKDAFIEKACKWLKSKGGFTIGFDGATVKDFLDYINK